MRFRHAMATLMPFGAASALAILPVGASTAAHATTVDAAPTTSRARPRRYCRPMVTPGPDTSTSGRLAV